MAGDLGSCRDSSLTLHALVEVTSSLWASVSPTISFSLQTCSSESFPSQQQAGSFFLPAWGSHYMPFFSLPHQLTLQIPSEIFTRSICGSHSGLGPGVVQTLLTGHSASGLAPAVCAPLERQRDPLKPNSGHIPPLLKSRTSPSYPE